MGGSCAEGEEKSTWGLAVALLELEETLGEDVDEVDEKGKE